MKRKTYGILISVLVSAIILLPLTMVSAKTFKLDFATALPEGGSEAIAMKYFKKIVEERTNGQVKVNFAHDGAFLGGVTG